jgi:anaerobic selenocysteine-containing dehydrogenase
VGDIVPTATTALATHVLPGVDTLERSDVTTSGRWYPMILAQHSAAVVPRGAERRPAWWVVAQLGRRLGLPSLTGGIDPDVATDDDVLAAATAGGRTTIQELRDAGGAVVLAGPEYGWVLEHVLDDHRWDVAPVPLVAQLADLRPPAGSLVLQTGRERRVMNSSLHGMHVSRGDGGRVLVHPDDAASAGVLDGGPVRVTSPHGSVVGIADVTSDIRTGAVHVPHSFATPDVGLLTDAGDADPATGMALFIGVPVTIGPG